MFEEVRESAAYLNQFKFENPVAGIILGTGMHLLADEMEVLHRIPYKEIPHFPLSTVSSHSGNFLIGKLNGRQILVMQGRFHYYEGYHMRQLVLPVRVLKLLGVDTLLISNAAGALHPGFRKGDLMVIEDHINLQGDNPLIGPNDDRFGPRFPDMSAPYDKKLRHSAGIAAEKLGIKIHQGLYAAVGGPMLETRAEYRFLRLIGADAVGMSTVPEVITARHMQMRCMAVSVITDECDPDNLQTVTLEEIIAVANQADVKIVGIFKEVITAL